ncbi:HNH endonuclease [Listeria fleischmannii]|uniref:Putative HNH nuclease YajD n=1 Tax=Listeria fleischmannii subsp. fleischmannii TaxID=1671902 RepID=A0A2X3HDF3_9LIST|nr:HNH endonuclease signature motif containing protein [Listeria fleischmannii]EMG27527.1 hypothetical protein LFLEISCH_10829 [Listeria fleischmannii subsp. fleischmannii LU2006-1]SQC70587.1 HNH endonuclease [Listeria fleischmannii subsp. fleischmannii]
MARARDKLDQLYSNKRWRKVREIVLKRDYYLCQVCKREGRIIEGKTVHHIIELREDESLAYELSNLETVCDACHNRLHPERNGSQPKKKLSKDVIRFYKNEEL